jgi:hypothetical protein
MSEFDEQSGKYSLSDSVGPIALSVLDLELVALPGGGLCNLEVKYLGSRYS